jgi:hypothetical protein
VLVRPLTVDVSTSERRLNGPSGSSSSTVRDLQRRGLAVWADDRARHAGGGGALDRRLEAVAVLDRAQARSS